MFPYRTSLNTLNPTLVRGCSPLSLPPLLSFRTKTSLRPIRKRRSGLSHLFPYPQSCPPVTIRPFLLIKRIRTIPRKLLPKKACSPLPPSLNLSCPRRWRLQKRKLRSRSSHTMFRRRKSTLEGPSPALNPSGNDGPHINIMPLQSSRKHSLSHTNHNTFHP